MAPEQASGRSSETTERSDVYSLGVILYEILTGKTPFAAASITELLDKVATALPATPRAIISNIAKPLEAVCLKALAKDPGDRYQSTRELADDVRRFIADEPVSACSEPFSIKAARWARRHRTAMVTAASVLVVLVVALSTGAALLAQANQKTGEQKNIAEANAAQAEANAVQANTNYEHALATVNDYFTVISENRLLNVPGMSPLRNELLEGALDYYSDFVARGEDDEELQIEFANAHSRIARIRQSMGMHDKARESINECLAIHARMQAKGAAGLSVHLHAKVIMQLSGLEKSLGNSKETESNINRAIQLLEKQHEQNPADLLALQQLATCVSDLSQFYFETRNVADAIPTSDRSVKLARELVKLLGDMPSDVDAIDFKKIANGRAILAKGLATHSMLLRTVGQHEEASRLIDEAISTHENLLKLSDRATLRASLGGCFQTQGMLLRRMGKPKEGEVALKKAIEIRRRLVGDFPTLPDYKYMLSLSQTSLGVLHWNFGEFPEALALYNKSRSIQERLAADFPNVPVYQEDLASTFNNIAIIHRQQEQYDDANASYTAGIAVREKLTKLLPNSVYNAATLGSAYRNMGRLLRAQDKHEEALSWQEKSITQLEATRKRIGKDPRVEDYLRRAYRDRAETYCDMNRHGDAVDSWTKNWEMEVGAEKHWVAMQRARSRVLTNDYKTATTEAAEILLNKDADSETIYDATRIYSLSLAAVNKDDTLTPAEKKTFSDQFTEKAIAALKAAHQVKYFEDSNARESLMTNSDLDPIRTLKEFKEFVAQFKSE
jgi:eukaryotic-like serine/threonine-protein kinase